jgi:uncharacterized repeat protein (TIGR03803 family)
MKSCSFFARIFYFFIGASLIACTSLGFAQADSKARQSFPPSTVTILVNFNGTNGASPFTENLVQGKDGNLYGTTLYGGASNDGTVFKMTPAGALTTLHSFSGADGQNPYAGLVLGIDGNFYGTTYEGGTNDEGTVFKITSAGTLTTLHNFADTDGGFPAGALVQGSDKNFYGTTSYSTPTIYGSVFKVTPSGTLTTLAFFTDTNGYEPLAGLALGTDGNFYGSTATGGTDDLGTVFKITPAGVVTSLHSFDNTDGWEPEGQLIQGSDGNFYGTTLRGGANGDGEVFKISSAGTFTSLHSFDFTDGVEPNDGLVQATNGNFFGTTTGGGTSGAEGTIFEMTPSGSITTIYDFMGGFTDGATPFGGITQYTNGSFLGTTIGGGSGSLGTVFSFSEGLTPFVKFLPVAGKAGSTTITILGNGLSSVTGVTFNGVTAAFTKGSSTFLTAVVPATATSGFVEVTTSTQKLKSNVKFRVTK